MKDAGQNPEDETTASASANLSGSGYRCCVYVYSRLFNDILPATGRALSLCPTEPFFRFPSIDQQCDQQ